LKLLQKERRGRRRKQLPDDVIEKTRHWKSKDEAPDHTLRRATFGRGHGSVLRDGTVMNEPQETLHDLIHAYPPKWVPSSLHKGTKPHHK
jgi:hypothetical protein